MTYARLRPAFRLAALIVLCTVVQLSCRKAPAPVGTPVKTSPLECLIPMPTSVEVTPEKFALSPETKILVEGNDKEALAVAGYLAERLRPATGFTLPVHSGGASDGTGVVLATAGADAGLGDEGYRLEVTSGSVRLSASRPEGLFRGVQTLRQLFPAAIEMATLQKGPWELAGCTITDRPRFSWRGAMLDVSRHFFKVPDVKRYIDQLAYYKINRFHLHLSDDQGWRIEIKSWPKLATYGGSTQVGGGAGGYYTQAEYSELVAYAASRYMTVIPEIDLPGHTNAALASYPELNCSGKAPALYTGIEVGFSSLCIDKAITYKFIDDVVRELAAITPGTYIHLGGDEAHSTKEPDFKRIVERAQEIVQAHGKQMITWGEGAKIDKLSPHTLVQHWTDDANLPRLAAAAGAKVIMSPATKVYLDMKYTPATTLGQDWAARIEIKDGYSWDPATFIPGVTEAQIIGVEAPIWTETLVTHADIEYMAFPRLPGVAEVGWSPATGRNWEEYSQRLASHGPRLAAMGINFYRSPQIRWP